MQIKLSALLLFISLFIGGCHDNADQQVRKAFCCDKDSSPTTPIRPSSLPPRFSPREDSMSFFGMVYIPAGRFQMGANDNPLALPREFPQHPVSVDAFYMDATEVTNKQFLQFTRETNYKTVAERDIVWEEMKHQLPPGTKPPPDSMLKAGSLVFRAPNNKVNLQDFGQWWQWVVGANWRHPLGPGSSIENLEDHPVVHIAHEDALAYATWAGKRLATEAEWEWAARGGLTNKIYPWGDEHVESGRSKCNYWSGTFPYQNNKKDGYITTAPVKSYPANGYGLFDMAGNVWEHCADLYDDSFYSRLGQQLIHNPQGPIKSRDSQNPYQKSYVSRGGSFLCNDSYCASYRVSARMPNGYDSSWNHTGFRCVKNVH